jgi:hypothetical protein
MPRVSIGGLLARASMGGSMPRASMGGLLPRMGGIRELSSLKRITKLQQLTLNKEETTEKTSVNLFEQELSQINQKFTALSPTSPKELQAYKDRIAAFKLPIARSTSSKILNNLFKSNNHKFAFELLSNRFKYGIYPSRTVLDTLFAHYASLSIVGSDNDKLDNLDMLYKCFSLFLYYSIAPEPAHYTTLIVAGVKSQLEKGLERSIMAAAEQKHTLGWAIEPEAKNALGDKCP